MKLKTHIIIFLSILILFISNIVGSPFYHNEIEFYGFPFPFYDITHYCVSSHDALRMDYDLDICPNRFRYLFIDIIFGIIFTLIATKIWKIARSKKI